MKGLTDTSLNPERLSEGEKTRALRETLRSSDTKPSGRPHEVAPYRPDEIVPFVRDVIASSPAHREMLESGRLTVQCRGDIYERVCKDILSHYGEAEKLSVVQDPGSRTADFRVRLAKPLFNFQPGDVVVCESKACNEGYFRNELRNPDSHARRQMRETAAREHAAVALCFVPMEMQNCRSTYEAIKESMRREPVPMKLWMGLAHEGAVVKAAELAIGRTVVAD